MNYYKRQKNPFQIQRHRTFRTSTKAIEICISNYVAKARKTTSASNFKVANFVSIEYVKALRKKKILLKHLKHLTEG